MVEAGTFYLTTTGKKALQIAVKSRTGDGRLELDVSGSRLGRAAVASALPPATDETAPREEGLHASLERLNDRLRAGFPTADGGMPLPGGTVDGGLSGGALVNSGSAARISGPTLAGAACLGPHPETRAHPAPLSWPGAGALETPGELGTDGDARKSRESFGAALVARIAARQLEGEGRKERKKKKKEEGKEKETVDEQLVRLKLQLQQRFSRGVGGSHCPSGEEGSRISSGNASSPSARGDGHGRGYWSNRSFQHCSSGCKPFDGIFATNRQTQKRARMDSGSQGMLDARRQFGFHGEGETSRGHGCSSCAVYGDRAIHDGWKLDDCLPNRDCYAGAIRSNLAGSPVGHEAACIKSSQGSGRKRKRKGDLGKLRRTGTMEGRQERGWQRRQRRRKNRRKEGRSRERRRRQEEGGWKEEVIEVTSSEEVSIFGKDEGLTEGMHAGPSAHAHLEPDADSISRQTPGAGLEGRRYGRHEGSGFMEELRTCEPPDLQRLPFTLDRSGGVSSSAGVTGHSGGREHIFETCLRGPDVGMVSTDMSRKSGKRRKPVVKLSGFALYSYLKRGRACCKLSFWKPCDLISRCTSSAALGSELLKVLNGAADEKDRSDRSHLPSCPMRWLGSFSQLTRAARSRRALFPLPVV